VSILDRLPVGATIEDIETAIAGLSDAAARALDEELRYDWPVWARPEQRLPEGDWSTWLILAGRGFGKTRTGAETVRIWARNPNAIIALVGPTAADVRDVVIQGESGILKVFPPDEQPVYKPSLRKLQFPSGAIAFTYSAEEPERLRGPQHTHAYLDELAVYENIEDLWSNLLFGLRLGSHPRIVVTTTPKPSGFLRSMVADAKTHVTRGSTFANAANLAPGMLAEMRRRYDGTRVGRQELMGEILEEAEGALWTRSQLDQNRVAEAPELTRIVIAIDPATTSGENADECGIVAAGLGVDGEGYVLDDGSCRLPPNQWAARALSMFDRFDGDRIIAEVNNGGDLVESVIRTQRINVPYEKVHASRGKTARAEPVAALYEQKRVHHVGAFRALEDEMCNFVPGKLSGSPNRADALVWAISYLIPSKSVHKGRVLWM
jgi:phage terminase large subunit-like protein